MTIEEFASKKQPAHNEHSKDLTAQGYVYFMSLGIDFAKLHVEAALKAAQEIIGKNTVPNCSDHTPFWGVCVTCGRYDNPEIPADNQTIKDDILKCYPLTNIK